MDTDGLPLISISSYYNTTNNACIGTTTSSTMSKCTLLLVIPLLGLMACTHTPTPPSPTSWGITTIVLGHTLTLSSSPRFAGAISSLNWNGQEFINQDDHGRELQSAVSFDGLGECFNPTEAGSAADGSSDTTTSKLLYYTASGNQIRSSTQMAFWTRTGQSYPAGCGTDTAIKVAQNTSNLSGHTLTKQITVGFSGIANAIEYLVTFHVAEHHSAATFESLTGYLTSDFATFWTFDPNAQLLHSLADGPGEQPIPVIFSTTDAQHALGIYSPDLPQGSWPDAGYGRWRFAAQHTVKWNAVFRRYDTPTGDYSFRLYVLVGSLQEVKEGMTAVYKKFHP